MKRNQFHYLKVKDHLGIIVRYDCKIISRHKNGDINVTLEHRSNIRLHQKEIFKIRKRKRENFAYSATLFDSINLK